MINTPRIPQTFIKISESGVLSTITKNTDVIINATIVNIFPAIKLLSLLSSETFCNISSSLVLIQCMTCFSLKKKNNRNNVAIR